MVIDYILTNIYNINPNGVSNVLQIIFRLTYLSLIEPNIRHYPLADWIRTPVADFNSYE